MAAARPAPPPLRGGGEGAGPAAMGGRGSGGGRRQGPGARPGGSGAVPPPPFKCQRLELKGAEGRGAEAGVVGARPPVREVRAFRNP